MKKTLLILLGLTLCFVTVACGGTAMTSSTEEEPLPNTVSYYFQDETVSTVSNAEAVSHTYHGFTEYQLDGTTATRIEIRLVYYPNGGKIDSGSINTDEPVLTFSRPILHMYLNDKDEVNRPNIMESLYAGMLNPVISREATWQEMFTNPTYFKALNGCEIGGVKYVESPLGTAPDKAVSVLCERRADGTLNFDSKQAPIEYQSVKADEKGNLTVVLDMGGGSQTLVLKAE